MVSTDPISDMLTRIRNAIGVSRQEISLPHSKVKEQVAKILVNNGFLADVKTFGKQPTKKLEITINSESSTPTITEISRLSKPGRRLYVKSQDIPSIKRGRGIVVISTSKGLMTGEEAKSKHLGGELICKVY